SGGAFAGHDDARLGRLEPGLLADIVIMDRDVLATPTEDLDLCRAALTLCGGKTTWEMQRQVCQSD
ncbi:MAG: amidohydrolase family protein, partial [Hyphomicrobiales bacterium]|nr:amidohydrolase family protein [Hyphomicrobiales bacterium]